MSGSGLDMAKLERIPVVALVGRSGSGKTTLLVALIAALSRRGVRVAAIKHSPLHHVESDVPGTDSYRYWEAGAAHVGLVATDRVVHTQRCQNEPDLAAVIADVVGVDLILLEGYKRSSVEKMELIRSACDPIPLEGLTCRVAYVTDVAMPAADCPVFGLDEVDRLANFLVRRYLGE